MLLNYSNFNFEMVESVNEKQLMEEIKKLENSARQYQHEVSLCQPMLLE